MVPLLCRVAAVMMSDVVTAIKKATLDYTSALDI